MNTIATSTYTNVLAILTDTITKYPTTTRQTMIIPRLGPHGPLHNQMYSDIMPKKKIKTPTISFHPILKAHNINYKNQQLPIISQNGPYTYLGVRLVPSLKWSIQIESLRERKSKNKVWRGSDRGEERKTIITNIYATKNQTSKLNHTPRHRIHILRHPRQS